MYGAPMPPTPYEDEEVYARTEPVMDSIILDAYEAALTMANHLIKNATM